MGALSRDVVGTSQNGLHATNGSNGTVNLNGNNGHDTENGNGLAPGEHTLLGILGRSNIGFSERIANIVNSIAKYMTPPAQRYTHSDQVEAHNRAKAEAASEGKIHTIKPEYARYGIAPIRLAEFNLARNLNVGEVALFPSSALALMGTVLELTSTRPSSSNTILVDSEFTKDEGLRFFLKTRLPAYGLNVTFLDSKELLSHVTDQVALVLTKSDLSEKVDDLLRVKELTKKAGEFDIPVLVEAKNGENRNGIRELLHNGAAAVVGSRKVELDAENPENFIQPGFVAGGKFFKTGPELTGELENSAVLVRQVRVLRGVRGTVPGELEASAVLREEVPEGKADEILNLKFDALKSLNSHREELEAKVGAKAARIVGVPAAALQAFGMSALQSAIGTYIRQGSYVLCDKSRAYRNVLEELKQQKLQGVNICKTEFEDVQTFKADVSDMLKKLQPGESIVWHLEFPALPDLRVPHIKNLVRALDELGAWDKIEAVVVDTTTASPRPSSVDLRKLLPKAKRVIEAFSGTKHWMANKAPAGIVAGQEEDVADVVESHLGAELGIFELGLADQMFDGAEERIRKVEVYARETVAFLSTRLCRAFFENFKYPGHPDHPDEFSRELFPDGVGGMIYADLVCPYDDQKDKDSTQARAANAFLNASGLIIAASFGQEDDDTVSAVVPMSYAFEASRRARVRNYKVTDNKTRFAVASFVGPQIISGIEGVIKFWEEISNDSSTPPEGVEQINAWFESLASQGFITKNNDNSWQLSADAVKEAYDYVDRFRERGGHLWDL